MRVKGMGVKYATHRDIRYVLDLNEASRDDAQIARALDAASRAVEGACHRKFYPQTATRYFDWPTSPAGKPWRLWLDEDELLSVTAVTAGGVAIAAGNYFLEPANGTVKDRIEVDLSSLSSFEYGDTHQRNIVVQGVFGYTDETDAVTVLAEALDDSETAVDVASSANVSEGNVILVEDEWMTVTGAGNLTTGQAITADLTAQMNDTSLYVASSAGIYPGEIIQVGSERMLVRSTSTGLVTVRRAWEDSVLASHTTGATVFAPRTLSVQRGALGSTAVAHLTALGVAVLVPPSLVSSYVVASTVARLTGEKEPVELLDEVVSTYGRVRCGAV